MPTLYIIAGPNGAGKTTFARRFLSGERSVFEFVNTDPIAQGLAPYAPEAATVAAGRLMIARLREPSALGTDFALETTLSGLTYQRLFAEMKALGYRRELNFLWIPKPENSINRVARRVSQGGHHIPKMSSVAATPKDYVICSKSTVRCSIAGPSMRTRTLAHERLLMRKRVTSSCQTWKSLPKPRKSSKVQPDE